MSSSGTALISFSASGKSPAAHRFKALAILPRPSASLRICVSSASSVSAFASARDARIACQVLTIVPASRAANSKPAENRAGLFRRANLRKRYAAVGRRASTG
jgi:hypothetical protein